MITDEEIDTLAQSNMYNNHDVDFCKFARAIYQLGRQHQRESDAALCEKLANDAYDFERPNAYSCARAIRNNTGELK